MYRPEAGGKGREVCGVVADVSMSHRGVVGGWAADLLHRHCPIGTWPASNGQNMDKKGEKEKKKRGREREREF